MCYLRHLCLTKLSKKNIVFDIMPVISIIIPVYNAASYLHECIDSVLKQSMMDFELLLIDDGSTDGSGEICDDYALKESRIRVFHQANQGVSVARNAGLAQTKGEWVTFVDADDYLLPKALEVLYQAAIANDADFIYGNIIRRDGQCDKIVLSNLKNKTWINNYGKLSHFGLWGCLFKTSVIKKNKVSFMEGQAYGEDMIFKSLLFKHIKKITTVASPIYVYRVNPSSVTKSTNKRRSAHHQLLATKYLQDMAFSEKANLPYKKFILKTMRLSRKQIYRNVAFNPVASDCHEIVNDYYSVLGKTLSNMILLHYNVFVLRQKKILKNIFQRISK